MEINRHLLVRHYARPVIIVKLTHPYIRRYHIVFSIVYLLYGTAVIFRYSLTICSLFLKLLLNVTLCLYFSGSCMNNKLSDCIANQIQQITCANVYMCAFIYVLYWKGKTHLTHLKQWRRYNKHNSIIRKKGKKRKKNKFGKYTQTNLFDCIHPSYDFILLNSYSFI